MRLRSLTVFVLVIFALGGQMTSGNPVQAQGDDHGARLWQLVPPALEATCEPLEQSAGAARVPSVAALVCMEGVDADIEDVGLYLFEDRRKLLRWWDKRLARIASDTGTPIAPGDCSAGVQGKQDIAALELVCYRQSGEAKVRWVDLDRLIYGSLDTERNGIRKAYAWWLKNLAPSDSGPAAEASADGGLIDASPTATASADEVSVGPVVPTERTAPTDIVVPAVNVGFSDYQLVPMTGDDTRYGGPPTPTSLQQVQMTDQIKRLLDKQARTRLARQGFVIVPARLRLFHDAYGEQNNEGTPVFVTTDAAYHVWHQVFDKILRDLETEELSPTLGKLLTGMRENALAQQKALKGTPLEDDASRIVDLIAVASAELGIPAGKLSERALAEKALIDEHSQTVASPVVGDKTDYSLYTPRGHYTRSEALTRYFVAMSVLGQAAFELPISDQTDETTRLKFDGLRRAVLASRTLVGHPQLEALWRRVFEPTAFLVGVSDDYTPFELAAAVEATVPGDMDDPLRTTDDDTLLLVAETLLQTRPIRIDPERPSVRLMGTRFVIDSWIYDQLVRPTVEGRILASPLDLAAAFGSDFALAIQEQAGETAYLHYLEQMSALRGAVAARSDDAWGQTVYDAWLAAVEPMWLSHGAAFPDFMQTDAWATKSQQTGLGSYAELKHDTVLYTKQAVAGDMAAFGDEPPRAGRNWVEPDAVPFRRLSAMAGLTVDGLASRELLSKDARRLLRDYIELVDRLAAIAADELAGLPISAEDDDSLRAIGGVLEAFWERTGDDLEKRRPIRDDDAAIVADIMRGLDPQAGTDEVVEIGTGYIDRIFVIVPDDKGRFHVASGGVYSYYEFPWPTSDRLTDEAWRKMLRKGEAPDRPAWQDPLFP